MNAFHTQLAMCKFIFQSKHFYSHMETLFHQTKREYTKENYIMES